MSEFGQEIDRVDRASAELKKAEDREKHIHVKLKNDKFIQ